jgi:hypothetical protein
MEQRALESKLGALSEAEKEAGQDFDLGDDVQLWRARENVKVCLPTRPSPHTLLTPGLFVFQRGRLRNRCEPKAID